MAHPKSSYKTYLLLQISSLFYFLTPHVLACTLRRQKIKCLEIFCKSDFVGASLAGLIILFLLFLPKLAFANQPTQPYQDYLIKKSENLNLSQDQQWLNMVYYERKRFSKKYESIFDSKNFFLHQDGKTNPEKELEATLRSFFNQNYLDFPNAYGNKQTAQCAFKGRYEWLKKKLNFDLKILKEEKCSDFNQWKKNLNPKTATLIFASSYLNNPASMFGHTFLLINSGDKKEAQRILSHAINYSANTNETNGIKFTYKGLFGLYEGNFSILKYHKMLNKYSNLENRDIWEYDLNLSEEKLEEMLLNLWEINNNYANYYFFSENCSYILLKLLKISNSDISSRKKLVNWVIPSDTVIDINKANGLITKSQYRPSRASQIKHLMQNSNQEIHKLAKKIANEEMGLKEQNIFNNLEINQQKITYDLAYEYLQYSYQKNKKIKRDDMAKSSFDILNKRSKISGKTNISEIIPPKTNPLTAHNPSRISVKYGYNNIRKDFIKFSSRQAYQDLMDNSSGFLKAAQINVMDFDINYYTNNNHLKLERFNLLDIKSFSPRNYFFKPLSWQLEIGARNFYVSDQDFKLASFVKFGSGVNFDLKKLNSSLTFLINGENYYGKHIPGNNLSAIVPEINLISEISDKLKFNFVIKNNFFLQETQFNSTNYHISHNYSLKKDLSFDSYFEKKHYYHFKDDNEFGVGVRYYY